MPVTACKNVICMSYDADALSGPTHVNATQVYVTIVYICELCVAQRPTPPVDSLRSYVRIPTSEEFYARSTAGGPSQRGRLRGGLKRVPSEKWLAQPLRASQSQRVDPSE